MAICHQNIKEKGLSFRSWIALEVVNAIFESVRTLSAKSSNFVVFVQLARQPHLGRIPDDKDNWKEVEDCD